MALLDRFISIRSVGRFKSCSASGDVTFRRYTLIFAENGRGKTTLCSILRSLAANAPDLITGRKTLGSADAPEVQIRTSVSNIRFQNGAWNATLPNVAVFDGTYVSDNVFAGDFVDTEHRRNLYRVIIGADGVALAARVAELDDQIRLKTSELQRSRTGLATGLPRGMELEAYLALQPDEHIDAVIGEKEQELQAVQRAEHLQRREILRPIPVPVFPARFAEVLARTFADVSSQAETEVSEHIKHHEMGGRGEAWLAEGLPYIAGDACPFCDQSIDGIPLIQAFRAVFGREYFLLRDDVRELQGEVENAIGERIAASLSQALVINEAAAEFWQDYCNIAPPPAIEKDGMALRALHVAAMELLQAKSAAPLDAVAPEEPFTQALHAFEAFRTALGSYNAAVATANGVISELRRDLRTTQLADVQLSLDQLKTRKGRFEQAKMVACAQHVQLGAEKEALEQAKAAARTHLDAHTERVINTYGQGINTYLKNFNAGFRITTLRHTYRGGPPSTSYQIVINDNAVDVGDSNTPIDRPSFKNTLSAGDRSTLALAFFLTQLEHAADRANKVVVFDDPFTSMDSFRRNHTVQQIFRCGQASSQVVVLSHETGFLKLLWDRVAPAERKALQLARIGIENTTIAEWDIERAVQARFFADIDTLQRFVSLGEGAPMDVIQKIRPVIEGYCRNVCPTQFGETEMVGGIVTKIRDIGSTHQLYAVVDDFDELNVYCRRYHHPDNPGAGTEPIDDGELQAYARRTLELIGGSL